ncbi:RHS repeat-associated core domain-containing protein [Winogradskyella sp. 3972H.M.0a.05]|uniref:RHS repeat-associated core domain-containing protein n=1 Tax=Winogradskyella sp. 3972H.M.0a.05 TaxID=2950277 RepID=UPI003392BA04
MLIPKRHGATDGYGYGFQGQEKDYEIKGEGNSYTTHFRFHDSRIGRWLSLDPVFKADQSPYISMSNNPITRIDPRGDDDFFDAKGNYLFSTATGDEVRIINNVNKIADAFYALRDVEDANEEKLTKMLRRQSDNLTQYHFKSSKPISNILNHYGEKILPEGQKIIPSSKYGGGVMNVQPKNGQFIQKELDGGVRLGAKPQIYASLVTRYISTPNEDGSTTIESYLSVDPLLNTSANIYTSITHEENHRVNHVRKYSGGLYRYLGTGMGSLKGVINHLQAYDAEIENPYFSKTTENYRNTTAMWISIYINSIDGNDDIKERLHKKYEEKLDNYDRTYTNENYYSRLKDKN